MHGDLIFMRKDDLKYQPKRESNLEKMVQGDLVICDAMFEMCSVDGEIKSYPRKIYPCGKILPFGELCYCQHLKYLNCEYMKTR